MNTTDLLSQLSRADLDELLFNALRSVHHFEAAKVAGFGLNYESIYLLQFLRRRSPVRMSDIAAEMNIPLSTATRVVDRLERRGFLSRKKDRADKRSTQVFLKKKGEQIVRDVEEHTFRIVSKNLEALDAEKIRAFIETAVHMGEILKVEPESGTG
jgi:MarR family 2-MHQ and catechol resistance regulon transcriptional repressor